jgi:chitodextrinase
MSGSQSWRGLGGLAVAFLLSLLIASPASANVGSSASTQLWGVEIEDAGVLERAVVKRLRATRATVVASPRLKQAGLKRLRAVAKRSKLSLLELPAANSAALGSDVSVVRVSKFADFLRLAEGSSTRVVAILGISRRSGAATLGRAIKAAQRSATVDLVVRAAGGDAKATLSRYLTKLQRQTRGDVVPPSTPGNPVATPAASSVSLAWTQSQDDRKVAGYGLYRDGEYVGTTSRTATSFSDLTCQTHELAVDAFDQAGNRSAPSPVTAAPLGCAPAGGELRLLDPPLVPDLPCILPLICPDTAAPSQPGNFRSTGRTQTSVSLAWDSATDNRGVTGYQLFRNGSPIQTTTNTSATVSSLSCGTTYQFGVEARDAAGNTSSRAAVNVSTNACPDTQAPSVPQGMAWTDRTQTSVGVRWDASSDNVGVTGYRLYRNNQLVTTVQSLSYTFTGLTCGTSYTFAIEAFDAAGNASNRNEASGTTSTTACSPVPDTQAPSQPGNLVRSGGTETSVSLAWNASTDNVAVTGYRVYRDGTLVASPVGTSQTVSGLTCGTSYGFGVEAVDAAGNTSARATLTAATSACSPGPDTQAPSQPANLTRSGGTGTSVSLTWSASTDNVGVTGYRVYRDGTLAASPSGTSQTVSGLTCGTSYAFGVEARDAAGNTSSRATLTASTSACAPAPDTTPPSAPTGMAFGTRTQTSIAMTWDESTDNVGVTGYRLFRDGSSIGTTTQRSYTFTGLTCGTAYTFGLEAYDAAGNTSNRAASTGNASTAACDEPPPDPGGDATRFVTVNGSDSGNCTQAAPCASFARAYRVANPGEVVQVAGGSYPDQNFLAIAGKTGPNVVFQPAQGARVILRGLGFGTSEERDGPDYITVKNMETSYKTAEPGAGNQDGIWVGPGSTHITLENMDAGSVNSWFADHLTVKGGDYGPCDAVWGAPNVCGNSKQDASNNVMIDGATFHDYRFDETCFTSGADCHWECMYINAGVNNTIRNSRFRNCAIFDIFTTISGPDAAKIGHKNLKIYNNWFAAPWTETPQGGSASRATAVSLAWCQNSQYGYKDVLVGFNSFQSNTTLQIDNNQSCVWDNIQVVGNLMSYDGGCQSRWAFRYNVWSTGWRTGSCHSTDKIHGQTFPYVNNSAGASMDYHLTGAASTPDNMVPVSAGCPATDIDGQPRPTSGFCDAGADER